MDARVVAAAGHTAGKACKEQDDQQAGLQRVYPPLASASPLRKQQKARSGKKTTESAVRQAAALPQGGVIVASFLTQSLRAVGWRRRAASAGDGVHRFDPGAMPLTQAGTRRRQTGPHGLIDVIARPHGGLRPILQTQLPQDGLHVHLHRRLGDDHFQRDNLVRRSLGEHAQDQQLAPGESVRDFAGESAGVAAASIGRPSEATLRVS